MAAKAKKPPASKSKKGGKEADGKGQKKGRRKNDPKDGFPGVTVAAHPKAGVSVRRAKGVGGLAGFGLAAALSAQAGVPIDVLGERAIVGGISGYLIAWGASVSVWRQLVIAEMKQASELARERHAAAIEARKAESIA